MKWMIVGVILLGLIACGTKSNNELGEESPFFEDDAVNQLDDITIEMVNDSYEAEGDTFELIIQNDSEDEITYGAEFILEYYDEDRWVEVLPDDDMEFILIAYILDSGEDVTEELEMSNYEPLDSGEYRIIREFQGDPLAAEFEIME